jgi:DNA mismatch repair ATPase MutL
MVSNFLFKFNLYRYSPVAVLNFKMPTDAYDVNVTPDKRKVLLHSVGLYKLNRMPDLSGLYLG